MATEKSLKYAFWSTGVAQLESEPNTSKERNNQSLAKHTYTEENAPPKNVWIWSP